MRMIPALTVVAAILAAAGHASAQVSPTGAWSTQAPSGSSLPSATYGMYYGAGASDGTYMYYAGYGGNFYTQRYDPSTNSWAILASGPTGSLTYCGAAWANGRFWILGNNNQLSYIYAYDPTGDSWSTPSTSLTRHGFGGTAATAIGDDIYIFGGYDSSQGNYLTNVTRINVSNVLAPSFTNMPNHPGATFYYYGAAVAYDSFSGLIYYLRDTTLYSFDPAGSGSWSTALASCPVNHAYYQGSTGVLIAGKGRLYATGGQAGSRTDEYFPGANTWTQRATATYTRNGYGPAGAMFGSGTAYTWGGSNSTNTIERFTLPNYGLDPNDATGVQQTGSLGVTAQAGSDPDAGWTDTQITFSANCTDPDVGQNVRLEVQVKRSSDPWAAAVQVNSTFGAQGNHSVTYTIPSGGDYDWRYHVADDYYNFNPNVGGVPSWHEFMKNAVTADFRSDQVDPSVPVPVYPVNQDVVVPSLVAGDISFSWSPSTDNGPVSAITYGIEVALDDPAFGTIAASAGGIVPTNVTLNLATSRYNYYYQLNATDIGGNTSAWSAPTAFRVVGDDGINHGSGDAKRVLGCSSTAGPGPLTGTLAALALAAGLAAASRRR